MPPQPGRVRVATYNLRFADAAGPHRWADRRPVMVQQLRELAIDVLATQEGLAGQLAELMEDLGYLKVGQGRDGGTTGEHTAILYDGRRFEALDAGDRWLSLQPDLAGSVHPAARLPRMLSWVRLAAKADGAQILVVSTHLSHVSARAREHGARMVLDLLAELEGELPAVVAGDFNAAVGSDLFGLMTARSGLRDAAAAAHHRFGDDLATFTGFGPPGRGERIDWLLVNDRLDVLRWEAVRPPAGCPPPSDHLPVVADVSVGQRDAPGGAPPRRVT